MTGKRPPPANTTSHARTLRHARAKVPLARPRTKAQKKRGRSLKSRVPTRRVLAEIPLRAATFLMGVGRNAELRAVLADTGYTKCDHHEGLELISATLCYGEVIDHGADERAGIALDEVHDWTRTHWRRLRVAIERLHPGRESLFAGVEFPSATRALLALAEWLWRIEELELEARQGCRESRRVLETLERRGAGADHRAWLAERLRTVQSAPKVAHEPARRQDDEALLELYRWFVDWSTAAHAVVTRKDWLIALGLSARTSSVRRAASEDRPPMTAKA